MTANKNMELSSDYKDVRHILTIAEPAMFSADFVAIYNEDLDNYTILKCLTIECNMTIFREDYLEIMKTVKCPLVVRRSSIEKFKDVQKTLTSKSFLDIRKDKAIETVLERFKNVPTVEPRKFLSNFQRLIEYRHTIGGPESTITVSGKKLLCYYEAMLSEDETEVYLYNNNFEKVLTVSQENFNNNYKLI